MTDVRIEAWIKQGLDLYKEHFGLLVVATLISVVASVFTLGILAGPMAAGLYWVSFRLLERKEPPPQATDVFKGFDVFVPAFLFVLAFAVANFFIHVVLDIIPIIGWIASIAATTALSAATLFVVPLLMEQRMDLKGALEKSWKIVQPSLLPFMLFSFVAGMIGVVGILGCGVGIFFTLPITTCSVAIAYRDTFGAEAATEVVSAEPTADEPATLAPPEAGGAAS